MKDSHYSTTNAITVAYDLSDRGKIVYAIARWENTRGEKGPWSPVISAVIP
jgi:hypothetical protein